jgi:hypothetical protein
MRCVGAFTAPRPRPTTRAATKQSRKYPDCYRPLLLLLLLLSGSFHVENRVALREDPQDKKEIEKEADRQKQEKADTDWTAGRGKIRL